MSDSTAKTRRVGPAIATTSGNETVADSTTSLVCDRNCREPRRARQVAGTAIGVRSFLFRIFCRKTTKDQYGSHSHSVSAGMNESVKQTPIQQDPATRLRVTEGIRRNASRCTASVSRTRARDGIRTTVGRARVAARDLSASNPRTHRSSRPFTVTRSRHEPSLTPLVRTSQMRGMGFEPRSERSTSLLRIPERIAPHVRSSQMRGMGFEPMDPYGSGS